MKRLLGFFVLLASLMLVPGQLYSKDFSTADCMRKVLSSKRLLRVIGEANSIGEQIQALKEAMDRNDVLSYQGHRGRLADYSFWSVYYTAKGDAYDIEARVVCSSTPCYGYVAAAYVGAFTYFTKWKSRYVEVRMDSRNQYYSRMKTSDARKLAKVWGRKKLADDRYNPEYDDEFRKLAEKYLRYD